MHSESGRSSHRHQHGIGSPGVQGGNGLGAASIPPSPRSESGHNPIEAFWRSLKHAWLFLHSLDNITVLHRLIEFYVVAHNQVMPHSAFGGETPDEMFFGIGDAVALELVTARKAAREKRITDNRAAACGVCSGEPHSRALQLQRPRSRMP